MPKNEETYEEQVRKEFESTQPQDEPKVETSNLGKVNHQEIEEDPEIQRIKSTMDYVNLPLDTLPSGGRFYPEGTRILIRAARVNEIREFSMINEEDPKDIRDKMIYIISQCTKVYFGNNLGHFRDILEDDSFVILFKIRELTFVNGQTSIKIPVPEGACQTTGCKPQEYVYFDSSKLEFKTPSTILEKYYDPVERCYNVQTKSFGTIKLYPPTIGVTTVLADWIRERQLENGKFDMALTEILPYVVKDWRMFTNKQVYPKITEMAGWSKEKFTLIHNLKNEVKIGIEYEIKEQCAQCGGELTIPVTFPDGFKSLFVPTISDFRGELV